MCLSEGEEEEGRERERERERNTYYCETPSLGTDCEPTVSLQDLDQR